MLQLLKVLFLPKNPTLDNRLTVTLIIERA